MIEHTFPSDWRLTDQYTAEPGGVIPLWVTPVSEAPVLCGNCGATDRRGVMYGFRLHAPGDEHGWCSKYFPVEDGRLVELRGRTLQVACPVCGGTQHAEWLLQNSGLRGLLVGAHRADRLSMAELQAVDGGQELALGAVRELVGDATRKGNPAEADVRAVTLWGGYGSGKTYLLCAAVADAIRAGRWAHYTTAQAILTQIAERFNRNGGERPEDVMRWMLEVPLLAVDEVVRINWSSEWVAATYFDLMDKRLASARWTLCASNVSPASMTGQMGGLGSRLSGTRVVEIRTGDIRPALGEGLGGRIPYADGLDNGAA